MSLYKELDQKKARESGAGLYAELDAINGPSVSDTGASEDAPQLDSHAQGERIEEGASGEFSTEKMIANIPSSAARLVQDLWGAASDIPGMLESVAGTTSGLIQKGVRKAEEAITGDEESPGKYEAYPDAIYDLISERYGSEDALKNTVMEDPVGAMMDFAGVLMGGVKAAQVASGGAKYVAGKMVPEGAPANMMESAMKPSTTMKPSKREAIIETALDEKLMPTAKGVDKLKGRVDALDSAIDDLVSASGAEIPVNSVLKHLGELSEKKGGFRLGAKADQDAIGKYADEIKEWAEANNRATVTAEELQKFKRDAYKDINWDARRATGAPIKEDAYKAMARGAKEALEEAIPEIGPLNQRMGKLLELEDALVRAANRIENRNLISIDTPMKVGAGGAAAGASGASVGAVLSVFEHPKIKAWAAIQLRALSKGATLDRFKKAKLSKADLRLAAALMGKMHEQLKGNDLPPSEEPTQESLAQP